MVAFLFFFFQAEDGIRDADVTGVQTCALPICYSFLRPRKERYSAASTCGAPRVFSLSSSGPGGVSLARRTRYSRVDLPSPAGRISRSSHRLADSSSTDLTACWAGSSAVACTNNKVLNGFLLARSTM